VFRAFSTTVPGPPTSTLPVPPVPAEPYSSLISSSFVSVWPASGSNVIGWLVSLCRKMPLP
jgi:hypothetical protein